MIEWRTAEFQSDRLSGLAAELVGLPVEIIATDGVLGSLAAKQATTTIPIVFFAGSPVEYGLVDSLAHPGRNLTGTGSLFLPLFAKQVEVLTELRSLRDRRERLEPYAHTERRVDASAPR